MKFKNILLAFIPCIIALGCKKQDIMIWDSELAGVYFQAATAAPALGEGVFYYADSTKFSFANGVSTTKDTILMAPVQTVGKLLDYPRQFKVYVDTANSTALEGIHYEIDQSSAVVPAGAAKGYVRVKFKRTDEMRTKTFRLVLKLEDNALFKVYMEKQTHTNRYTGIAQINADRYTFFVDDIVSRPRSWGFFTVYWGSFWSAKKYTYINSILGWTHHDWTLGWEAGLPPIQEGRMSAAASKVRDALQALANAGTPMLDENGSKMQLGGSYAVRY